MLINNVDSVKNVKLMLDALKKPQTLFSCSRLENYKNSDSNALYTRGTTDGDTSDRVKAIYQLEREPAATYHVASQREMKRPQTSFSSGRKY